MRHSRIRHLTEQNLAFARFARNFFPQRAQLRQVRAGFTALGSSVAANGDALALASLTLRIGAGLIK